MLVIKKVAKQCEPLFQYIYDELAAKNIDLQGRRLMLTLLVSIDGISHETRIFNDREPPWSTNKVKKLIENEINA